MSDPFAAPRTREADSASLAGAIERARAVADRCQALAATSDEDAFPAEAFRLIAEAGLLTAPLPHRLGGYGVDGGAKERHALLKIVKEIGRGNLAAGRIYEGHVNALQLIQAFGTSGQLARWAAEARERDLLFAVWNTEAADGVSLRPLPDGRWRVLGAKTFASGAGHVSRAIVTGRLPDGGWHMFVAPMERIAAAIDPSWWKPLGMRASVSARIDFSGAILDADDLLGKPDDYHRQPWFSGGAVRFAAAQLGGAEALLDAARATLRELGRAGDPYQRQRIGEGAIAIESGNLWLRGAADIVDLGPNAGERDASEIARSLAYANMTRTAIEAICLDIIRLVERSVGARGMLQPHPIERLLRDLTMYLRQPAPDAALSHVGQFALESDAPLGALWPHERE